MRFRIKAIKSGVISEFAIDASDEADAKRRALNDGFSVLSLTRNGDMFTDPGRAGKFPLLSFNQELLALLNSGISLIEALDTLVEKESSHRVRNVLEDLAAKLREGLTLSAAFGEHPTDFPAIYIATIRASERTSDIEEALSRYIHYQTQLEVLRSKLISAAVYPSLLVAVGGLVIVFLMAYVVPRFSHIYEEMGNNLPLMSRLLLAWGNLLQHHGPILLACVVALIVCCMYAWRQPGTIEMIGRMVWQVPFLSTRIRTFQLTRFYRTLGMLLRGGLAAVPALDMVASLLSPMLRPQLLQAMKRIQEGIPISDAMERYGLVTPVALRMLRVGERAGNMGDMMERIAAFHDEEIARHTEWLMRLFGPLLMLLIGFLIGIIVVLMYLPIFQLAESIK